MSTTISDVEISRLVEKYDLINVPWYLSYPAISKWKSEVTEKDVLEVFEGELKGDKEAYLYLHFPYCETLCYYCACYMSVTKDPKQKYDEYLSALDREMEMKIDRVCSEKVRASNMHWGGGTPTYMSVEQIEHAFKIIDRRVTWSKDAVLSVEAYPDERTLSDEKVEMLRSLGFNQISFGIESLDPKVLEAINRKHDIESIRRWMDKARNVGFGVHVDLVYGLPYQTLDSLRETVEQVLSLRPNRVATYPFTYTPLTVKHQRAIPRTSIPGLVERFRLYHVLEEVAQKHGYTRVGADHWVHGDADPLGIANKRGEVIHHFMGYEPLDRETWLGFGASAISFAQGRYFLNRHSVGEYVDAINSGKMPLIEGSSTVLSDDDRIRHYVICKDLLADLRIDKDGIEKRFGINFDEYFAEPLKTLRIMESDGLVEGVSGRIVKVTDLGRPFLRNVCNAFDRYLPLAIRKPRPLPTAAIAS